MKNVILFTIDTLRKDVLGCYGNKAGLTPFLDSIMDRCTVFDNYQSVGPYTQGWLSNYTKQPDYKPFFLWAHYMDVHEPYVPDQKYVDMIDPSIKMTKEEMFALFKEVILPRDASDPAKVELLRKLYCAHVIQVDEYAKEFFGNLEKLGLPFCDVTAF